MTRPIGVGVAGTGFAAAAHIEALRRLPEVRLVAVAGHDPERTHALADRYGVRAYLDHLELLEDPAVEAVHTCTVNERHHDVNLAALERGRHVLSEKPLALDGAESARLAAAAERAAARGQVSGVCFNYRHYPLVVQLREMLRSGDFGPVHFAHGRYLQDWLLRESDWNWRVDAAGSRAVADIGSHWTDLVQHLTGDPIVEVLADLGRLHAARLRPAQQRSAFASGDGAHERVPVRSEDFGSVLLRFASGARGNLAVSQVSAGRNNGLWIELDTASAAFAWDQESPDRAWVGRRAAPNLELVRDPESLHPRAARLARLPAGHPEGWLDALRNLLADFYASVAARRAGQEADSDVASFADGHARVQLVDAIVASDRDRAWTPVPTTEVVTA